MVAAATCPEPASPKSEGAEYCLDAFGAYVFNALRSATIAASPSAQRVGVGLASNNLNLDSAQHLLALLESQPNLLRRQVGDRASNVSGFVLTSACAVGLLSEATISASL
jgi:hypothetical protein